MRMFQKEKSTEEAKKKEPYLILVLSLYLILLAANIPRRQFSSVYSENHRLGVSIERHVFAGAPGRVQSVEAASSQDNVRACVHVACV